MKVIVLKRIYNPMIILNKMTLFYFQITPPSTVATNTFSPTNMCGIFCANFHDYFIVHDTKRLPQWLENIHFNLHKSESITDIVNFNSFVGSWTARFGTSAIYLSLLIQFGRWRKTNNIMLSVASPHFTYLSESDKDIKCLCVWCWNRYPSYSLCNIWDYV